MSCVEDLCFLKLILRSTFDAFILRRKKHFWIVNFGLDLKYWLHKIGKVLDTVCRKCGIGAETVEQV